MRLSLRKPRKRTIELAALIVVYALFAAIGLYSGQTRIDVDLIHPSDEMEFRSSPVELVASVAVRGAMVSDVRARFTIRSRTGGESNIDVFTDAVGIARLLLPASSGNYTWRVTAIREGYPTIVSASRSFSIRLSLTVDALMPSHLTVAVSPVEFKARVADRRGLVEFANVSFYVDSAEVGRALTGQNGIGTLSAPVTSGSHTWFAAASKNGEGGLSDLVPFVVGQLESLTGEFALDKSPPLVAALGKNMGSPLSSVGLLRPTSATFCELLENPKSYRKETCSRSMATPWLAWRLIMEFRSSSLS